MDIKRLSSEETHHDDPVEVTLYDDNGEPEKDSQGTVVKVWIIGEFSKPVRRVMRQNQGKITRLVRRYGGFEKIPQSETDALYVERVAAHVVKWQGFESDGVALPYSDENAIAIVAGLQAHRGKQFKQLEGEISEHASFFAKPSTA